MRTFEQKRDELFCRNRPEEPLKYWVRERPPAARGERVEHWIVLYGPRGCAYGELPFKFDHWEVARAVANALTEHRPSEEQVTKYLRGR